MFDRVGWSLLLPVRYLINVFDNSFYLKTPYGVFAAVASSRNDSSIMSLFSTTSWSQAELVDVLSARCWTNTSIFNVTLETGDCSGHTKQTPSWSLVSGSIQRKDRVRGRRVNSCWRVKVTRYRCSMLPGSQWCILGTEHQLNPSICFLTFGFWPLIHFCFCDRSIIREWWYCDYH